MPPLPFEYEGREVASRFFASIFGSGRRFDLVPTRAHGQPALGAYVLDSAGISHGVGLFVLTLAADRICAMTRFENSVLPWFGLPGIIDRSGHVDPAPPEEAGEPAEDKGPDEGPEDRRAF